MYPTYISSAVPSKPVHIKHTVGQRLGGDDKRRRACLTIAFEFPAARPRCFGLLEIRERIEHVALQLLKECSVSRVMIIEPLHDTSSSGMRRPVTELWAALAYLDNDASDDNCHPVGKQAIVVAQGHRWPVATRNEQIEGARNVRCLCFQENLRSRVLQSANGLSLGRPAY